MIGFLRLMVMGFAAMTVAYFIIGIYSRSVERERLEKEWDGDPENEGAAPDARDAYIEAGMRDYAHSLRRKLIWLVYIIPMGLLIAVLYYNTVL